jgi:hypothetical protein
VLDLGVPTRSVAGVDLAADSENPDLFYVFPPVPKVAFRNDAPDVQLLRFVGDGQLTGGHFRLSVCLSHPPSVLEEVRASLVEQLKRDTVTLATAPVADAAAEVLFVGRETTESGGLTSLLKRGFARTSALLDPPHTASFAVSLTAEGTRLFEGAMRSGGAPIGVTYWLRTEGLWPAQHVVARVDWGRAYDHFSVHQREGFLLASEDIRKITESLIENRVISIQAVRGLAEESEAGSDSLGPAMDWVQRELVERFCEPVMPLSREPARASLGTFGEIFGVGYSFAVKKLKQVERATGEIDFQRSVVLSRTIAVQAHLADLLGGSPPDEHIVDAGIDHPFFQRMVLRVRSAQALPSLHLKEALLHFSYGSTQEALRLTPDSPEAVVETWANASPDRTWSLRPEITFSDDAPLSAGRQVPLPPFTGESRELTLDLKRMLRLARYELRQTPDPRVLLTEAQFFHRRGTDQIGELQLALSPQLTSQLAWFRDLQPGDRIEVEVRHLLSDSRLVKVPPFLLETETVRIPPAFPGAMTVQLLADDDWSGLDRVIVAIQKQPDSPTGTFIFDKAAQVQAVNLEMPDPADRKFRYRTTRTWSSGEVQEDEWVESDVSVVVVGKVAANMLVVDVAPTGVELPQAGIRLIEVELSYIDVENQVRDQKTFVIGARGDRFRWEVPVQNPQRRSYEFRIKTHRITGGPPEVGRWTTTTDRILPVPIVATA